MPARIVRPSSTILESDCSGLPSLGADLETEVRRFVRQTLEREGCEDELGALGEDGLEALACLACEAIGDGWGSDSEGKIGEALAEVGLAEGVARAAVLQALAGFAEQEAKENQQALPAAPKPPAKRDAVEMKRETKWLRRGDVNRARVEACLWERSLAAAEEERQERERGAAAASEAVAEVRTAAPKPTVENAVDSDSEEDSDEDEMAKLDRDANKHRLRQLGQPVTLFGESDCDRAARLRRVIMSTDQDELATGSTNVMQILDRQAARQAPEVVREEHRSGMSARSPAAVQEKAALDDEDAEPVVPSDGEAPDEREADDGNKGLVLKWLRTTLREWEKSLAERGAGQRKNAAFESEKAQFRQSKQYLRPLRRSLRSNDISPDIVMSLASIATSCGKRDYKAAKEAYMRLAIGNSPWPMGVTLTTFHDRPNRHSIGEGAVAHVLDDETTRKYVQMVKRLCTFCEGRWPIDPSLAA